MPSYICLVFICLHSSVLRKLQLFVTSDRPMITTLHNKITGSPYSVIQIVLPISWSTQNLGPPILIYNARSPYSDICKIFHFDLELYLQKYVFAPLHMNPWWGWCCHSKSLGPLILIYNTRSSYSNICQRFEFEHMPSYIWGPIAYIAQFWGNCSFLWLQIDPWSQHTKTKLLGPPIPLYKSCSPYPDLHKI